MSVMTFEERDTTDYKANNLNHQPIPAVPPFSFEHQNQKWNLKTNANDTSLN